jgi:hypothetical protein
LTSASARGVALLAPQPLEAGQVIEFDLLLGARPIEVVGRVLGCRAEITGGFGIDVDLLAVAQVDRDSIVDFLQAVGPGALRVRPRASSAPPS